MLEPPLGRKVAPKYWSLTGGAPTLKASCVSRNSTAIEQQVLSCQAVQQMHHEPKVHSCRHMQYRCFRF